MPNTIQQPRPKQKEPLWTKDFLMIALVNFFYCAGAQMFPAALPPYVKTLGGSDAVIGWMSAFAAVATLIIRPFTGIWLDSLGRRVVLLAGLGIAAVSAMAFYSFPVIGVILALRFIHGIGTGMAGTASNTVATDCIPKSRFGEGMGFFTLSMNLGMAMAPALALALAPNPMIVITSLMFVVAFGVSLTLKYRQTAPREKGAKKPFPYEKAAILPAIMLMLPLSAYSGIVTFLAIYAKYRGIDGNIGVFFTVYAITVMLTRPQIGMLADRKGPEMVILPALTLTIIGLIILAKANSMTGFLICASVFGLGMSATLTCSQSMAILNSPADRKGAATATFYTGFDLGMGGGAMLAGYLATFFGYENMFVALTALPLLGMVIFTGWLVWTRKKGS